MTENHMELSTVSDSPDISMSVNRNLKQPAEPTKKVREISPVTFFDRLDPEAEENMFDFRPVNETEEGEAEEEMVAPKVLSAPELADSLGLSPEELEESSQETPADVEKDSGPPKETKSGTPTS